MDVLAGVNAGREEKRGARSEFSKRHKAVACERGVQAQIAQSLANYNDTIITATQSTFPMPGSVLRALDHKVPHKWVLLLTLHCAGEKAEAPHG